MLFIYFLIMQKEIIFQHLFHQLKLQSVANLLPFPCNSNVIGTECPNQNVRMRAGAPETRRQVGQCAAMASNA